MDKPVLAYVDPSIICFILFLLMLLALALGNNMRKIFWQSEEGETSGGVNSLMGALFGLWSFILAFTFGQSSSRFENVRALIVDEANVLRTAIIKADLFPGSVRNQYRADLRKYLEERIAYYDDAMDHVKFNKNREELSKTAADLWSTTVVLSKDPGTKDAAAGMALTLTTLFDTGIKREALLAAGIPQPISFLLIMLALTISLVGGFTTPTVKRKEWIVIAAFALLASTILYITMDLATPMSGLIKPDTGQITIVNLRKLF
ncbi:hypothetical protein [Flavihumibacter fluvii]|uniref:bestrophin-like domain n=1 Tax=Flavihumibacter fluvii TaxID=2838157 RepID=UPI001BDDF0F3|nr:hypothetical protein [Flavihumibacter fluvii]ULQ52004.1 hypothetical protein KJS93_18085 [Flavihumibacter fluvii]